MPGWGARAADDGGEAAQELRGTSGDIVPPRLRGGWRPLFELLQRKKREESLSAQDILRVTAWDPKTLTTYVNKGFFRHVLRQTGERFVMLKNGIELSQAEFARDTTQVKDDEPSGSSSRMRPCPALAKVIGTQPVSRVDLTQRLWAYVRGKGLQAPEGAAIQCDEALRALCGKATISSLELVKVLYEHLVPLR
jgi:chromatin remodeling complex protein RSC6